MRLLILFIILLPLTAWSQSQQSDFDLVHAEIHLRPSFSEAKEKLLRYYLAHEDRMQYKTYWDEGLLIGSGPIEAAHRGVIQQRMKRSGQKWSHEGVQAMANLRCYRCSNAWSIVQKIIKVA